MSSTRLTQSEQVTKQPAPAASLQLTTGAGPGRLLACLPLGLQDVTTTHLKILPRF